MTKQEQANVNYLEFLNGKVTPFSILAIGKNGVEVWPFYWNHANPYGDFYFKSSDLTTSPLIYYSTFLKAKCPELPKNDFSVLINFYKRLLAWLKQHDKQLNELFINFENYDSQIFSPNFKKFARIKIYLENGDEMHLIDEELTKFLDYLGENGQIIKI